MLCKRFIHEINISLIDLTFLGNDNGNYTVETM